MDTVLAPGDSIVFLDIDTTTNQEVRVVYKHNFDGGSSIAVDCPDVETKTITVSEVTDLSDETKRKIEDRFRREYEKKEGKLLKEIEKDQKRKYKEWYKEGVSDGKSKGRWQIIIMIAVAAGLVLFIKKKLPLNFPF